MRSVRVVLCATALTVLSTGCGGVEGPSTPPPNTPRATSTSAGNLAYERSRKSWGDSEWSVKQAFSSEGLTASSGDAWAPGTCENRLSAAYDEDKRPNVSRSLVNLVQDGWAQAPNAPKDTQFVKGDLRLSVSPEHDASEPDSLVASNVPLKYVTLDLVSTPCATAARKLY
ncbi:hypothetical protein [Streptomyces hundungensis]|uniref:hypothetical protein n=1 Tax=Streptomyces hundungensis TaxID=1077946 RepID=UPI0033E384B3